MVAIIMHYWRNLVGTHQGSLKWYGLDLLDYLQTDDEKMGYLARVLNKKQDKRKTKDGLHSSSFVELKIECRIKEKRGSWVIVLFGARWKAGCKREEKARKTRKAKETSWGTARRGESNAGFGSIQSPFSLWFLVYSVSGSWFSAPQLCLQRSLPSSHQCFCVPPSSRNSQRNLRPIDWKIPQIDSHFVFRIGRIGRTRRECERENGESEGTIGESERTIGEFERTKQPFHQPNESQWNSHESSLEFHRSFERATHPFSFFYFFHPFGFDRIGSRTHHWILQRRARGSHSGSVLRDLWEIRPVCVRSHRPGRLFPRMQAEGRGSQRSWGSGAFLHRFTHSFHHSTQRIGGSACLAHRTAVHSLQESVEGRDFPARFEEMPDLRENGTFGAGLPFRFRKTRGIRWVQQKREIRTSNRVRLIAGMATTWSELKRVHDT